VPITAKLNLLGSENYGAIGEPDEWGYHDVIFTFTELLEVVNEQAVCSFSMTINGVLINSLFRLSFPALDTSFSPAEAESALGQYLQSMYLAATTTQD
jgi:hypothetical protein